MASYKEYLKDKKYATLWVFEDNFALDLYKKLGFKPTGDIREERNSKLLETDWIGLSDVTMSDAMATYRQALRDLPTHDNWPNLGDDDWPTAP